MIISIKATMISNISNRPDTYSDPMEIQRRFLTQSDDLESTLALVHKWAAKEHFKVLRFTEVKQIVGTWLDPNEAIDNE